MNAERVTELTQDSEGCQELRISGRSRSRKQQGSLSLHEKSGQQYSGQQYSDCEWILSTTSRQWVNEFPRGSTQQVPQRVNAKFRCHRDKNGSYSRSSFGGDGHALHSTNTAHLGDSARTQGVTNAHWTDSFDSSGFIHTHTHTHTLFSLDVHFQQQTSSL